MDTTKKLYIALAVLAALAGGVYLQKQNQKKEAQKHSFEARAAELPKIEVTEEQTKEIDTIEITQPPKETKEEEEEEETPMKAAGEPTKVVLVKAGEEEWNVKEPVDYKANASNVTSLLNNLKSLKVVEQISEGADSYDKWGVTDEKGVHAVFKKGDQVILDVYFGDSGTRGQMTRLQDKEGVYSVKGYSKYLYTRDLKGWRDKTILKFEDKEVAKVTVENENGTFVFTRTDDGWNGEFKKKDGAKFSAIEKFKPSKVDDLLRAYKSLNASDFGDGKQPSDVGLAEPAATVTIEMKGDSGKHIVKVGDTSEGTNRWVQNNTKDTIFSISSWSADWATAEVSKFQEGDDSKKPANPHAAH